MGNEKNKVERCVGGFGDGGCLTFEAEIITNRGIKQIGSLSGSKVDLLVGENQYVESKIRNQGDCVISEIVFSCDGHYKTIRCSKAHKWITYTAGEDVRGRVKSTHNVKEGDEMKPVFNKLSMDLFYDHSPYGLIHGAVFDSKGVYDRTGRVRLHGVRGCALAEKFNFKKTYLDDGDVFLDGVPSYYFKEPDITMDLKYLHGWLMGFFAANGEIDDNGKLRMFSASKDRMHVVRDIMVKIGVAYLPIVEDKNGIFSMVINNSYVNRDFFVLESQQNKYRVTDSPQVWIVESVRSLEKSEPVYFVDVPEFKKFVVEGNFLSLN